MKTYRVISVFVHLMERSTKWACSVNCSIESHQSPECIPDCNVDKNYRANALVNTACIYVSQLVVGVRTMYTPKYRKIVFIICSDRLRKWTLTRNRRQSCNIIIIIIIIIGKSLGRRRPPLASLVHMSILLFIVIKRFGLFIEIFPKYSTRIVFTRPLCLYKNALCAN